MKNQISIYLLIREKLSILFNSEKQLVNYLQVIRNKSQTPALQSLLSVLIEISYSRISQLNHLFEHLEMQKQGVTCEAINGLIRENLSLISLSTDNRANEQAIINFLQQVNRYKSTAYAWLQTYISENPQYIQATSMIQEILNEESSIANRIAEVEHNLLFLARFREQLVTY